MSGHRSTSRDRRLAAIPIRVEGAGGTARTQRPQGPWARRIERWIAPRRHWLDWIHATMFVGFMVLLGVPLALPLPGDQAQFWNNFTLFANFVIWGLWFPLVFVSVIFTGRSWCGLLCPLGACSEWANRIGRKRPVPRWMRWPGTPIASFVVITVLAQTVGARDHALGMAEIFGATFVLAALVGFFYGPGRRKRAWCRHMCPIGLMLGVFSRIGAVQFQPKRPIGGDDRYTQKGICPTMIDINRKRESRHCIECFRCVRPDARGGLRLVLRAPGREVADIRRYHANAAEIWFLLLATGLSLGGFLWLVLPQYQWLRQVIGRWAIEHGWYWIGNPGPWWLMSVHPAAREVFTWLDFFMISGFMLACALLIAALLGGLSALGGLLARRLGANVNWRRCVLEQAYAYMPVAMISLVVGLGGKLFSALTLVGLPGAAVAALKLGLFAASLLWSLGLSHRLIGAQGLGGAPRWLAMTPTVAGTLLIGLAWWPAIFGL